MRRGEVRWYTFAEPDTRRPVLILTRNSAIGFLAGITVAPLTSTIRGIPTEVLLTPDDDGVHAVCVVNLDNIQTVQKRGLGPLIATVTATRLAKVERAVCSGAVRALTERLVIDCNGAASIVAPYSLYCQAVYSC